MEISPLNQPQTSRLRLIQYILAVFLFWVSLYLYYPTLSIYVETITDDLAKVGTVLAMYGFWQMVIRIPLGMISDWFTRKKPLILIGFLLSGLGALIMAQANGYAGLLIGRTITSFSASFWVILVVVFSRLFPAEEAVRATALLTLINTLGRLVGTGLNGWLNDLGGYTLAFYVAVAVSSLAVIFMIPGKERTSSYLSPSLSTLKALIKRKDIMVPSWLSVLSQYMVFGSTFGFIPILAKTFGASNVMISMLMVLNLVIVIIGNLLVARLIKRFSASSMILCSFFTLCLGLIVAGLAKSLPMIFVAQVLIGASNGVHYPTLMGLSIERVDSSERSTAMGIHQSVYAIGMFAGPWICGLLANWIGIEAMFILTGCVFFVVSLFGVRLLSQVQQDL
jgi:predicted MFS family arabinose efflux permease